MILFRFPGGFASLAPTIISSFALFHAMPDHGTRSVTRHDLDPAPGGAWQADVAFGRVEVLP